MRLPLLTPIITCLASLSLTGCFSTTLSPTAVNPTQVARARSLSAHPLPLVLRLKQEPEDAVGYQYILFGIPVARVYAPSLRSDILESLTLAFSRRDYALSELPAATSTSPRLEVTVSQVTVSGYDLFVVRRPSSSFRIAARLISPNRVPRECEAQGDTTHTARFAFGPELERALRESIERATEELLTCFGPTFGAVSETAEVGAVSETAAARAVSEKTVAANRL